jgi:hypothetical protein
MVVSLAVRRRGFGWRSHCLLAATLDSWLQAFSEASESRNAPRRSLTSTDLVGKLGTLVVECPKCGRTGRYAPRRLIEQHGRDGTITA